jgi:protocatechuate 3,4-dioxygenase beta subunit
VDGDPNSSGLQALSAITNSAGAFAFPNVIPGVYLLKELQPGGYINVTDGDTSNPADDPINASTSDNLIPVTTSAGETDDGNDFVERPLASISGIVLEDIDNDGDGDDPIQGVTLLLCDGSGEPVDGDPNAAGIQPLTAITNADGAYAFVNVAPGSYIVKEVQPAGYITVKDGDTTNAGDDTENTSISDNQIPVTLNGGEIDTGNDFVEEGSGRIMGIVMEDTGIDDIGDAPISGVVIQLCDTSGNPVDDPDQAGIQPWTTLTDNSGGYAFFNVAPGSYLVKEVQPAGYNNASDGDSTTPDDDATNISTSDNQIPVTITGRETDTGNDFVEYVPAAISGVVLLDENNDDVGDAPISGVTMTLCDGSGNPIDSDPGAAGVQPLTRITASDGTFSFNGLRAAVYQVKETQPPGYLTVLDEDSATDLGASPVDPGNTLTTDNLLIVSLSAGETDAGNDFVEELPSSISGMILADTDNDDDGDVPIDVVTLTLCTDLNGDGDSEDAGEGSADNPNEIGTQDYVLTTTAGNYAFSGLAPGSYVIKQTQPSGYVTVTDLDSMTDLVGSPADASNSSFSDNKIPLTLMGGETDTGNDFIEEQPAAITGNIYADTNNDNDGDVPINVVTLTLCIDLNGDGDSDDAGEQAADNPHEAGMQDYVVTTTDGTYAFTDLAAGSYVVKETQPIGYLSVTDLDSTGDTAGSPPDASNASLADNHLPVTVMAGETDSGNDFIEERALALGNLVFSDVNNDGNYDAGMDFGIDGVTVKLFNTGADNGIGGGDDVEVNIGPDGILGTADDAAGGMETADGGCYLFQGLASGNYYVQIPASELSAGGTLAGYYAVAGQGGDTTSDDNADENGSAIGVTGVLSTVIALALNDEPTAEAGKDANNAVNVVDDNNTNLTVDFGFVPPAAISGSIYVDIDNDDNGDALINVVTLTLCNDLNADGDSDDAGEGPVDNPNMVGSQDYVITTTNGTYAFTGLAPGAYVVKQTQPSGYLTVTDLDSTTDDADSPSDAVNASSIDDRLASTVLAGETDSGNDFIEEQAKVTDFATWQSRNPLGGQNGPTQNPDGDRYDNLAEYAFCIKPDSGSNSPLCVERTGIASADLIYTRAKALTDVTFTVQTAANLGNPTLWSTLSASPVIVDNGDGTETVSYANVLTAAAANGTSAFYRICAATTTQTTYTEIQGWVRHNIVAGCATASCPLLPKAVLTGSIGTVSGQNLDLSSSLGSTSLTTLLAPGTSYFLEITSGDHVGHRFDIYSATASSIIVADDSDLCGAYEPYNTLVGAAPATLTGDSFAIYAHRSINELFPVQQYQSGNSVSTSDRILIKRGGAWDIYWLYTNGAGPAYWDLDGDGMFSDEGSDVVPPSQGFFVHKVSSDTEVTACIGEVRTWAYCTPLCEADGCTLVAPGYPVDQSPTDLGILLGNGWNGDADPTMADKFITWNGDSGPDNSYTCYWLADAGPPYQFWTVNGDATLPNKDTSKVFLRTRSAFLQPMSPKPTRCQAPPITP